jgi:hypothetical protein
MASVDVETGAISPLKGVIDVGDNFTWTCNEAPSGTNITVYAALSAGSPWFKTAASPQVGQITFTAPGPSASCIAEMESPAAGWTWTAAGVNVEPNARVNVGVHMDAAKKVG